MSNFKNHLAALQKDIMIDGKLDQLGWKPCFQQQLSAEELEDSTVARVGTHFGSHVICHVGNGDFSIPVERLKSCGDLVAGDWILLDSASGSGIRRLDRESLICRKSAGEKAQTQLISANIDSLFIVSSCNNDFNPSRLERYLALARESRISPIVVLTKADLDSNSEQVRREAEKLMSGLLVETIDARDPASVESLVHWCRAGQTVALVGSSGVGKSTLAMTLGAGVIATQGIREDDSKGRHTTTTRSIHCLHAGGVLIDTPGMRELQLVECETGLAEVFDDIAEIAKLCRFRDCDHDGEPGCAVAAAIGEGELNPRRLRSYRKLQAEQLRNSQSLHERRGQSKKMGQYYKAIQATKRQRFD